MATGNLAVACAWPLKVVIRVRAHWRRFGILLAELTAEVAQARKVAACTEVARAAVGALRNQ